MTNTCIQAMGKLVGHNWEYYMTQPIITLGRGGTDVDCQVVISKESAVSRRHFCIRYVPELQAFEIKNLSKNGILINGEFTALTSAPRIIRSQTEIAFGKHPNMICTFILPPELDRTLNGTATGGKNGGKGAAKKETDKKSREVQLKLLNLVGKSMVDEGVPLTFERICEIVMRRFSEEIHQMLLFKETDLPKALKDMEAPEKELYKNNIHHILHFNPRVFENAEAYEEPSNLSLNAPAKFAVRNEHKSHFLELANQEYLHGMAHPMGKK